MKKCVLVVAVTWMNDETGRFIDDEQIIIFIDDIERYVLRCDGEVMWLMIEQDLDDITGFDAVVGGHRLSVDPYVPCIRSRLDTVTAGVGHMLRQVFVNALFALTFIYLASPSFPQQIVFDDIGYL